MINGTSNQSNKTSEIKNIVGEIIDKVALSNTSNSNLTNLILKTDIFTVNFIKQSPGNKDNSVKNSIENNLSFGNYTNCENILKEKYNISESESILIRQVEYDSITDPLRFNDFNSSKGLSVEFYHPISLEKLDKSFCESASIQLSIPFKKSERIKMTNYLNYKSNLPNSIDIYNIQTPSFHTRCLKSKEIELSSDLSINYRRTVLYQNSTISCSEGCNYLGLDENKYVQCDCPKTSENEVSNTADNQSLFSLPPMNYDIVICYKEALTDVIFLN